MGTIYKRGKVFWIRYKDVNGKWVGRSTCQGSEKKARAVLDKVEARIAAGEVLNERALGPVTVERYATRWIERRKLTVPGWKDDEQRLRRHVLPRIGNLELSKVRPRQLKEAFVELRIEKKLAPHTIRNVYSAVRAMFRDAMMDDLVDQNPCILRQAELGADRPKNTGSSYTKDDLERLISDERIPAVSRMLWAFGGLAGLRLGEIAALRWSDLATSYLPLARLTVSRSHDKATTKTGRIREVPVHPTLAAMLAEWKLGGWAALVGRPPVDDDLILPRDETGEQHTKSTPGKRAVKELALLGIPKPLQPVHSLRATFITLTQEHGAKPDFIRQITHTGKTGRAFDLYTKPSWEALCAEVAKLQVERRKPSQPVPLRRAPGHENPVRPREAPGVVTALATPKRKPQGSPGVTWWRRRESKAARACVPARTGAEVYVRRRFQRWMVMVGADLKSRFGPCGGSAGMRLPGGDQPAAGGGAVT